MDIGTIRGLGTVVVFIAFIGLALWVFSGRRKSDFDEANLLPFADDPEAMAQMIRQKQQQEEDNKGPKP
ncbi:cbb3-type cytochrome c oxidase subunit 3 [Pseudomonas sp. dw_358]|uniref:cbb3-type cytochrome oxidase subunit 3 n=1 Tax=Pseudomonas sp. dw_358 TaxID=2720083 RepID=UPI001BD45FEC|nr:cbb3-type cytochrome c oxidase subunit 3 [Pseudomonas sp. dw_358]